MNSYTAVVEVVPITSYTSLRGQLPLANIHLRLHAKLMGQIISQPHSRTTVSLRDPQTKLDAKSYSVTDKHAHHRRVFPAFKNVSAIRQHREYVPGPT